MFTEVNMKLDVTVSRVNQYLNDNQGHGSQASKKNHTKLQRNKI